MGFVSSHTDLCNDGSGYDYICTHVDDFLIFTKDLGQNMSVIQGPACGARQWATEILFGQ
jgi:hypothetical protein